MVLHSCWTLKEHGRSPHASGPGPRPTSVTTDQGCPSHFRFKTWSLAQPFRPRKTRRSSRGRGGAWRSCSSAARASPRRRRTSTVSPLQTRPDPPSATPRLRDLSAIGSRRRRKKKLSQKHAETKFGFWGGQHGFPHPLKKVGYTLGLQVTKN